MPVSTIIQHSEVPKVARQLAMRTVVEWFGNLSFDQQSDVLGQMQQEHEGSRSAKRAELEMQLSALGYGVSKKKGRPRRVSANGAGNGTTVRKGRKAKVKAKYRDPIGKRPPPRLPCGV